MRIENVSFVVIAKNEGKILEKTMSAICDLNRKNCEIICVDSDSNDDTLSIFKKYASQNEDIQVYKIKGELNAACAMNVGIKYANKKYIFFVDGDVVIDNVFIEKGVDCLENKKNIGGVVGYLKEYQYLDQRLDVVQNVVYRRKYNAIREVSMAGGIILIRKSVVDKVGLFDECLSFHQDWDYCLRVKKSGFSIVNIAIKMGEHFTVTYRDTSRMWHLILAGKHVCSGLILRKYIFNINVLMSIVFRDYGIYLGSCVVLFAIAGVVFKNYSIILLTTGIFLLDVAIGLKKEKNNLLGRIIQHYLSFGQILYGFLFFYPKKRKTQIHEQ